MTTTEIAEPDLLFSKKIAELGGEGLSKCYQCATCSGSCPTGRVSDFRIRKLIRQAQLGMQGDLLPSLDPWLCTQCAMCYERCPKDVNIPDVVLTLRKMMVDNGMTPEGVEMLSNTIIENYNPLAQSHDDRTNWIDARKSWNSRLIRRIKDEEVREKLKYVELGKKDLIKDKADIVYFVGCNSSYPRINQGIPDAFVHIMHAVGEDFTLLGQDERCCADPIFLSGHHDAFKKMAEYNLKEVEKRGATKLVMTCAGCYRVFKHEYPKYLDSVPDIEIIHATELLDQYIRDGRLSVPEGHESPLKVTYHDPCEIGRIGRIFEPPRRVLEGVGIQVLEMVEEREQLFCCGGGGLVKVTDKDVSSKLSFTRIGQAEDVGAEIIASACPSCKITIRDGVLSLGKKMGVMDVTELVAQQLGLLPPQR